MSEARSATAAAANQTTTQGGSAPPASTSLLDQIVEDARFRGPEAKQRGKDLIKDFLENVLRDEVVVSKNAEAMVKALIGRVDHLLSIQLRVVMHHPDFQKLEATWRGLKYLLDGTETSTTLKIRVLNVSKRELLRDQERAIEFDQSELFKK